jgi:branched-chain amino acid transport system permease protein
MANFLTNWIPSLGPKVFGNQMRFKPLNIARGLIWGITALIFLVMPHIFTQGFAITLLSQMGVMIIFCLSYNMLFGQGGMLSFGHAVYSGLGAFFAIHTMNSIGTSGINIPMSLIPLVGGIFGALFGVLFGYVTTKKSGTPFAMITLGIGELVFACSLMFPLFFGGEGGITGNRTVGQPFLGVNFSSGIQVYYLIAFWCFISMIAMYAFSHTPLGRISNAVRDNPERVEFVGYDTQKVRYLVLIASAFFAGIAGGLTAIIFEIVSAENVHASRSGGVLLATFIGGAMFFFGPILGAIIFTFFVVALSEYTKAWQLYLGVFFVVMVMFAPGGIASLVLMNLRVAKYGLFKRLRDPYVGVILAGILLLLGVILILEMGYHWTLESATTTTMKLFGFMVDTGKAESWVLAIGIFLAGAFAMRAASKSFGQAWGSAQEIIEDQIKREVKL